MPLVEEDENCSRAGQGETCARNLFYVLFYIDIFLSQELSKHVDEYTSTYEPDDQLEWSLVLGEIKSFLEADAILNILDADSNPMVISHRYFKFLFLCACRPDTKRKGAKLTAGCVGCLCALIVDGSLFPAFAFSLARLSPLTTPPVERSPAMDLTLQEVLIVGNNNDQVKFSELTLDMFRILQTLEREPQQEDATYGQAAYSLSSRAPSMVRS